MLVYTNRDEGILEESYFSSSNVLCIRYLEVEKIMEVLFNSGRLYTYHEIPRDFFIRIRMADSQGSKINELLVKKQVGKKLYNETLSGIISPEDIAKIKNFINEKSNKL